MKAFRKLYSILVLLLLTACLIHGQQPPDSSMTKLTAVRNDFISKIKSMGHTPGIDAPKIVLDNPRSFGNYDSETNILHTCDWNTLPPPAKDVFNNAAKGAGNGMTGHTYFE